MAMQNTNMQQMTDMEYDKHNSPETLDRIKRIEKHLNRRIAAAYRKEIWESLEEMSELCTSYADDIRQLKEKREFKLKTEDGKDAAVHYAGMIELYEETLKEYRRLANMSFLRKWVYVRREARLNTRGFGACHQFWEIKKSILKEAYGIEWYTPQEEYPHMHFD